MAGALAAHPSIHGRDSMRRILMNEWMGEQSWEWLSVRVDDSYPYTSLQLPSHTGTSSSAEPGLLWPCRLSTSSAEPGLLWPSVYHQSLSVNTLISSAPGLIVCSTGGADIVNAAGCCFGSQHAVMMMGTWTQLFLQGYVFTHHLGLVSVHLSIGYYYDL